MIFGDVDLPQKLIERILGYGFEAVLVPDEPLEDIDQFFAILYPRPDDPGLSFLIHDVLHIDLGDHGRRDVDD